MKKTYKIEVDCANCAAKMENKIKSLDGINDVIINFMTQKLIIDFTDTADVESVMQSVLKTCKKIERDVVIK